MACIAGEKGAVVCLGIVCIAASLIAGCTVTDTGFALTEEVCEKLSGLDRDHCYQQVAVSQGWPVLCEKIEHPGPRSKCLLYLGQCRELNKLATGDGAYTSYDCWQYNAEKGTSIRLCEEAIGTYVSSNRNDLNPSGISKEICIKRVTAKCGHIGQEVCVDHWNGDKLFCVEGRVDRAEQFCTREE